MPGSETTDVLAVQVKSSDARAVLLALHPDKQKPVLKVNLLGETERGPSLKTCPQYKATSGGETK